jgi:hypothetical protein
MTLQLLPSEFPHTLGKFYFLFYQCSDDNNGEWRDEDDEMGTDHRPSVRPWSNYEGEEAKPKRSSLNILMESSST